MPGHFHRAPFLLIVAVFSSLLVSRAQVARGQVAVGQSATSVSQAVQPTTFQRQYDYLNYGYRLIEPSGITTANVSFAANQMVADDANGKRYVFHRDPQFDSLDGQFAGYWHPALDRVVRFPRSGHGLMQVANLADPFPRFVASRRRVRRATRRPRPVLPPAYSWLQPGYGNPYTGGFGYSPLGYGGFGYPGYAYGYQSFGPSVSVGRMWPRRYYAPAMQSIVLSANVVAHDPLPPVQLDLLNAGQREIRVTVIDRVENHINQLKIAPGTTHPLTVKRDAGADYVRNIQTYAPDGSIITRQVSTPVDPAPRYELVVHEWMLQSVAIDRTGKSPNRIEDTNFQGKGLGRFELPPGQQLSGGRLDVIRTALDAGNAGTVSPLLDDSKPTTPTRPMTPLERALQAQRQAAGN